MACVMQVMQVVVSTGADWLNCFFSCSILLQIYHEPRPVNRRLLFALLGGAVPGTVYTYALYALQGFSAISPLVKSLAAVPNPVFAILLYIFGVNVLRLEEILLMRIIQHLVIYTLTIEFLTRFWRGALFAQTDPAHYNHMLEMTALIAFLAVHAGLFCVLSKVIAKMKAPIMLNLAGLPTLRQALIGLAFRSCLVFAFAVLAPLFLGGGNIKNIVIALVLLLSLVVGILNDASAVSEVQTENKDVYIGLLTESISNFKRINNKFYDIIQEYSNYIDARDLDGLKEYHQRLLDTTVAAGSRIDLDGKIEQNPTFMALLAREIEYAGQSGVALSLRILCDISDLYLSEFDASRVFSNLLNNAIEAAADSERKYVSFSIERKPNQNFFVVISNATPEPVDTERIFDSGVSTKDGHTGLGLALVRKIIEGYSGSSISCSYGDNLLTVYLELSPGGQ